MSSILRLYKKIIFISLFFSAVFLFPFFTNAATLRVDPTKGTFTVGETFDVSILLDTEGRSVNALHIIMDFSPDKLQIVSPTAGKSIIGVWTATPQFNNQVGRIELQGGIPNGINVSNGLVATFTFRVRSTGQAVFRFLDGSKVLLNDGFGTNDLVDTTNGIYQLVLPPPEGPRVISETHPDQSLWYSRSNVSLTWTGDEEVRGYSYVLNREPVYIPDDISQGRQTSVNYQGLSDGVHYFHIKSLRNGTWGGVTHFALHIDTTPPARFPIEIIPLSRTTRRQPVIQFETTDTHSGINHYELKIIPLTLKNQNALEAQPFFIEIQSPHLLHPLEVGRYDVIVRAYDKAGNYQESIKRLSIVSAAFGFFGEGGIEIGNILVIPWIWFWIILLLMAVILFSWARRTKRWHNLLHHRKEKGVLPKDVQKKLEELNKYRDRYGPRALIFLAVVWFSALSLANPVLAQSNTRNDNGYDLGRGQSQILVDRIELTPPLIDTVSRNISNEEIFYVGGKTEVPQTDVIVYLQNLQTGETFSYTVVSDKNGNWFYRNDSFLKSGNYLLWAQNRAGEQLSPPGPQFQITVRATAIQFGSSRISYEVLYLAISLLLLAIVVALIIHIAYHKYHGHRKHARIMREVREAEESVRRGFERLHREIRAEFDAIKKAKFEKNLSQEEQKREEQIIKDLKEIEWYIGKEVWDIEEAEYQ